MDPKTNQPSQPGATNTQPLQSAASPTLQQPASPAPPPLPPVQKSNSVLLIVFLALLVLILLASTGYFAYQYFQSSNQVPVPTYSPMPRPTPQETPTPSPSATPEGNLETYTNPVYKFELKYPSTYRMTEDKYGWPESVLLLYKSGQSYDLVVEVWDNKADYETKYKNQLGAVTVKESAGKFITLLNMNQDPEVDEIIASFKFID